MIGTVIAEKYEIVRELGKGGMGEVYEARHVGTGRRAALKLIRGILATDDGIVARFQREARAAGAIESPHITQVFDTGKDPETGSPFIVMELLDGEDVDSLLLRLGPLRPTLALRIVAHALAGLERAHAATVIHRDLKPANLFLAKTGNGKRIVKLVDFGIAKVKDDLVASQNYQLTQTSTLLGSPMYMSPEQAKSSKHVDARADIWSLGVVLWQLLVGKTPFAHTESLTELLLALCTEPVPPVQEKAPWVPAEIADIASKALMSEPADRWASATEMLGAVAKVLPDWETLGEEMLVPMTDEERAVLAPISERTAGTKAAKKNDDAPARATTQAQAVESGTAAPLSTSRAEPAPRSRWRLVLSIAAAAGIVGVVAGTMVMNSQLHREAPPTIGSGLVATPAVSAIAPEPSASASPPAPPASSPSTIASSPPPRATAVASAKPHASVATSAAVTTPKPKPSSAPTSSSPISREFN